MPDVRLRTRDLVDELAEEFVERYRRGERPSLTEYIAAIPRAGRRDPRAVPGPGADGAAQPGRRRDRRVRGAAGRTAACPSGWATTASSARSAAAAWASSTRPSRSRWAGTSPSRCCPPHGADGPDAPGALPPRGPGGGAAAPHQHRAGLRRRRARRRPLLRHAVHPRPGPRPGPRRARAGSRRRQAAPADGRRGTPAPASAGASPTAVGRAGRDPPAGRGGRRHAGHHRGRRSLPPLRAVAEPTGGAVLPQRRPDRRAGGRGPGLRPPAGRPAPRHQAVQPAARHRRAPSGSPTSAWPRRRAATT